MTIEPVSEAQLKALERALGPLQSGVLDLHEVDLSRGRGVLEGNSRCLWTKDKRRITIGISSDGGLIGSCSRDPDPEYPESQYSELQVRSLKTALGEALKPEL